MYALREQEENEECFVLISAKLSLDVCLNLTLLWSSGRDMVKENNWRIRAPRRF